jgi:predicted TIM-barrel enzyme
MDHSSPAMAAHWRNQTISRVFLSKVPRLDGYVGGSSAERFPIEEAVPKATKDFKAVKLPKR